MPTCCAAGFSMPTQYPPRPGQPWHYGFHADVEFAALRQLKALLADLEPMTEELRVLGAYRRGSMAGPPLLTKEGAFSRSENRGG